MDDLLGLGEDTPVPQKKLGASMAAPQEASDTDAKQHEREMDQKMDDLLYGSAPATKTQKRNTRRRALKRSTTAPAQSSTGFCVDTASAKCIEELKRVNAYVEQRLAVRARARDNVDDKHKFVSAHRDYEDVERPRSFLVRDDGYHCFYSPKQQMRLGVDANGYSTSEGL